MPFRLMMSSGDLIADRRFDFARDLQLRGELEAAAELMEQAVELAPRFASGWFALGDMREELGQNERAIEAYRQAVAADAEDRHGARLRLIRLGAEPLGEMSAGYVRALFDQYAPKFDNALRGELRYRGPEILLQAVHGVRLRARKPVRFRRALDLGCGTGLAGQAFASLVETIDGVDLSPAMIAQAEARAVYARLAVADMLAAVSAEPDGSLDLVLAADALVYVGDLQPLFAEIARVLMPGGLFAFTVESCESGYGLGTALRYTHSAAYLKSVVDAAGLRLVELSPVSTRIDAGVPVAGLVGVAERP
ncbi:class I SAM-dependent methyltransferase [Bradyrhizobium sp. WD16]|uniref:class I SAM-dependent DNA methyltransferase n=1 Tax=Bradyrhizobium sp. WD16 TaxID=1521768 RepID=UPI0020A3C395|nr:methyltransferase domain-containing protein [Bradyrhizobium sp. WD16]UTD26669.1 SAM-dependent methyltransferase [Bradyrhizobium sp. WD16]